MKQGYLIVGAGKNGVDLLRRLGKDQVSFFADNNEKIVGKRIEGIEVISVKDIPEYMYSCKIIVAVEDKTQIKAQLDELGINEYTVFLSDWRKECFGRSIFKDKSEDEIRSNQRLKEYSDVCKQVDPIHNVGAFRELVIKCKNDRELNGCYNIQGRDWESLTYGHFKAITQYAGIKDADSLLFPVIPHAPFFFDNLRTFGSATLFSSTYLKRENNSLFPYIPSFSLGEYMQYVQPGMIENNPGDNTSVVVFMHHSVEALKVMHEHDYLMENVFGPLFERYEKVYLSTYWYDIDDELYERIEDAGVRIVSAGFRFDEEFIYRLRAILDMCEDVVVFGRTSALIYALSMGKKLFYHKEQSIKTIIDDNNINHHFLSKARLNAISAWEDVVVKNYGKRYCEYPEEDKRIVDYYFGISLHRSPKEIQVIYDVCKDIWEESDYVEEHYPMAVYRTYWKYQINGEYDKLTVLSEALPAGFWNL